MRGGGAFACVEERDSRGERLVACRLVGLSWLPAS